MRKIIVSAPGKIHLSGEHSVVYGESALLSAIDRRLIVSLEQRKDRTIKVKTQNLKLQTALQDLENKSKDNLVFFGIWKNYQILNKKPKTGFNLEIQSQIPMGSGLGSSAALSAALSGVILEFEGVKFNRRLINKIAYEIEKKQHGNPSGGDNTVVCFGGLLKFQKTDGQFKFQQLKTNKDKLPEFLLVNSGKSEETTGEMVELIRLKIKDKRAKKKIEAQKLIQDIGKITGKFIASFDKNQFNNLKDLISENQKLLEELGVAGEKAKKIIRLIQKIGGAGKICGAGGIKTGSGMLLAYHPNLKILKQLFTENNLDFFKVNLGQKGILIKNG